MALYALQTAYAPVGWAALLKDPQNRMEAVKPVVQRLGGSVVDGWLTFGDYDVQDTRRPLAKSRTLACIAARDASMR